MLQSKKFFGDERMGDMFLLILIAAIGFYSFYDDIFIE